MSITKRVTYLRGLMEGLGLGKDTKEEKILHAMIEILDDIAVELAELKEEIVTLDDDFSELSESVEDLEDLLADCDCGCEEEAYTQDNSDTMLPAPMLQPSAQPSKPPAPTPPAQPMFYSVSCPNCSNEITLDDGVLELGAIDCPNCGERLEFDLDDDE